MYVCSPSAHHVRRTDGPGHALASGAGPGLIRHHHGAGLASWILAALLV